VATGARYGTLPKRAMVDVGCAASRSVFTLWILIRALCEAPPGNRPPGQCLAPSR
jgi:hypothetical protein